VMKGATRTDGPPMATPEPSARKGKRRSIARDEGDAAEAEPPVAVAMRSFALGPTPQNVDVYLDGERQFSYDTDHRTLAVPWNRTHVVEFRSPSGCCFVERVEVGPERPVPAENVIARKLKWRPARLAVTIAPTTPGARVMVKDPARPGRGTIGEPGEDIQIPFFSDDEDGQKEVEVSVDAAAAGFAAQRVAVRAGQRSRVTINLTAAAPP